MWSDSAGQTDGLKQHTELGLWLCYGRGGEGRCMGHDVRMLGG